MANEFDVVLQGLDKLKVSTNQILKLIGQRLLIDVDLRFNKAKAPDGSAWKPLAEGYRPGGQILQLNRILKKSIIPKVAGETLEIGTNIEYAKLHQFGSTGSVSIPAHTRIISQAFGKPIKGGKKAVAVKAHTKKQNVPARPFLGISKPQISMITKVIEDQIKKQTKGAVDV
jgi:phage gpG-like protein